MTGKEMGDSISSFASGVTKEDLKDCVEVLVNEHRTIQQYTMKLFMAFVEAMAVNGQDLRNQDSVNLAKAIMALPEQVRGLRRI